MAIKHKRKNTAGYTWQTADLVEGQLGLNLADGTLHFKKSNGSYVKVADTSTFITDLVNDTTPQLGGQLDVQSYKITTSVSNGNIELNPNGTGDVLLTTDTVRVGIANAAATVTTNGTGNLVLNTNNGTNSSTITINQGLNGNIELTPNGTGDVYLNADTVRVGDSGATVTVQSNNGGNIIVKSASNDGTAYDAAMTLIPGALGISDPRVVLEPGSLILGNTGGFGTLSQMSTTGNLTLQGYSDGAGNSGGGQIIIPGSANSNITIQPNGTGDVYLNADTVRVGDANAAATITTNGTGSLTLNTNSGTNSGSILINQGANGNIEFTPNGTGDVYVNADTLRVGDSNAAATITTNGTGNLTLNTNAGTTSGSIVINQGANGNIALTPNGTGGVNTSGTLTVTYTPATTTGSAILATGKDSQGGVGYFDFLKTTNTTSGATNANKTFRTNSTGAIEVINSAYTSTILSLTDAGALTVGGTTFPTATGSTGQVLSLSSAGTAAWSTPSAGATNTIILYTAGITIPNSSSGVDTGFWNILDSGGVSGVSVNQGSITLPAGTYQISVPTLYKLSADSADHRIRCTTDSVDMFSFSNSTAMTIGGSNYLGIREFNGKFVFSTSKTIAFTNSSAAGSQIRLNTLPTSSSAPNSTYSQVNQALTIKIQKLA